MRLSFFFLPLRLFCCFFFFFSSRRRHTRSFGDWSSEVCSSDLRRCRNQQCLRYHCPYRPEEEGRWVLPHGEFGLDVIALVGMLRYTSHRSIPEIHQALCDRGVPI